MTPFELSVRFFLQLATILVICRIVSGIARWIGQPPVVGEMIAGVLLGPSFFGLVWPEAQTWLFPTASRPILFAGAQVGLALYMFSVGLEFRIDLVRARWRSAAAISFSGIAAPFALGCALALFLAREEKYFQSGVTLATAMPFLGAAMAITAFPMLARIISERRLTGTREGALALASGAIDDAAAWCVLALVLASLAGDASRALFAVGGGIAFLIVLRLSRRGFRRLADHWNNGENGRRTALGTLMVLLMLSAWFTDVIGLYAVFGAFFLGAALPRGPMIEPLRETVEPLTSKLLVPLFFIYSGLNTRVDLLTSPTIWAAAGVVFVAAILGKAGACFAAARLCGEDTRTALGIGMLMNARGLMELIILNIGLERGIITPTLFTILVLMAIGTTLMATPLFNVVQRRRASSSVTPAADLAPT